MIESLGANHIFIMEPHADDAFLSLGGHIEEWVRTGSDVWILTVFSGTRKRGREAEAYAQAVGAKWMGAGCVEGQPLLPGVLNAMGGDLEPGSQYLLPGVLYLLPLGIAHPEHVGVREMVESLVLRNRIAYYLDQPYALTQKNGPRITELLLGKQVVSYRKPGIRKYRHVPIFKDQAKFYHYNPPAKLVQACELIVKV